MIEALLFWLILILSHVMVYRVGKQAGLVQGYAKAIEMIKVLVHKE